MKKCKNTKRNTDDTDSTDTHGFFICANPYHPRKSVFYANYSHCLGFFMFIYEPQFIADSVVNLMNSKLFDIAAKPKHLKQYRTQLAW